MRVETQALAFRAHAGCSLFSSVMEPCGNYQVALLKQRQRRVVSSWDSRMASCIMLFCDVSPFEYRIFPLFMNSHGHLGRCGETSCQTEERCRYVCCMCVLAMDGSDKFSQASWQRKPWGRYQGSLWCLRLRLLHRFDDFVVCVENHIHMKYLSQTQPTLLDSRHA